MSFSRLSLLLLSILVLASCMEKTAKPVTRTETAVVEQPTAPLAVERVIFDVPRGAKVFSNEGNSVIGMGTGCARKSFDEEWEGGREFSEEPELIAEVETALAAAKLDVVSSGASDLFQSSDTSRAAYRLGAVVKDMHFSLCGGTNALNTEWDGRVIAEGSVTVEWQLFSQLRQEVVYVGQTTGAAASGQDSEDGVLLAILNGVGNAAAELTHDEKFIAELQMASAGGAGASAGQGTAEPLVISGPSRLSGSFSSNAERAQAATVLIVGSGHGSGVLISSDGYLLTNYHVVGEANEVRVELDGAGVLIGQVLRRDPYRDVALIKVPVDGATALPLNTSTPGVGSEIYAIGAPLDTALTDTVTKGIVSSIRDLDGQRFIQGDLDIQPGNSGGPLTDPSGNVIGLTVSGIMTDGTSVGINFFIPIAEALAALNLTVN